MGTTQKTTRTILLIQLVVTLTAFALSFVLSGITAALSASVGGAIGLVATAYFAYRVLFLAGPGSTASQIARAFYIAEVIKIVMTGVLFALVLVWLDVMFLPFFLTYSATMLAYWIALPFI